METQGDKAGTKAQGTTMNWQTMKETQIHKGGQAEETQVNHVKIITGRERTMTGSIKAKKKIHET